MNPRQVLIISNPDDGHAAEVVAHLRELGVSPVLFCPELLMRTSRVSLFADSGARDISMSGMFDGAHVDFQRVDAIWYRRPRLIVDPEEAVSPEALDFIRDEWRALLESIYQLSIDRLWVSHPNALLIAARKPLQLQIARSIGFMIPQTLISNDPVKVAEFFEENAGKVVFKATGNGWVYNTKDPDEVYYVLTNRLRKGDLAARDQIALAPATFQQEIEKSYELRVNVVGRQVLAIKIDSQKSKISKVDWRRYDVDKTPYTPYVLPKRIAARCIELTRRLGLEFGAIDLIRTPSGDYVFLEINGNGQFLWAEKLSEVPVSKALAHLLAGKTPRLNGKLSNSIKEQEISHGNATANDS